MAILHPSVLLQTPNPNKRLRSIFASKVHERCRDQTESQVDKKSWMEIWQRNSQPCPSSQVSNSSAHHQNQPALFQCITQIIFELEETKHNPISLRLITE